jgi:hypothetical protein
MNPKDFMQVFGPYRKLLNERPRSFVAVKIAMANAAHCSRGARAAIDQELARELDRLSADYVQSAEWLRRESNREALRSFGRGSRSHEAGTQIAE